MLTKPRATSFDPDMPDTRTYAHLKQDGYYMFVRAGMIMSTSFENYFSKLAWHPCHAIVADIKGDWGCELYVPGKDHTAVKTAVNEQDPSLRLEAFMRWDLRADTPLEDIESPLPFTPWIQGPRTPAEALTMQASIPENLEGYVLKDGNNLSFVKMKRVQTVDLVITGTKPGKRKHEGLIGSVIVSSIEGHVIAQAGGMDDAVRAYLTSLGSGIIGMVCEVEFTDVTSAGKLDHPRFVRLRPDQYPERCSINQHPKLERAWCR